MRPLVRRILLLRPSRPPNRFFTHLPSSRPQLPFLSQPRHRVRWLTTERKQWLTSELRKAGKYTVVIWTTSFLLLTIAFGVQQEWLERKFPSAEEWSFVTRKDFRSARWNEFHGDEDDEFGSLINWARTGSAYRRLLERLEDPTIDGNGLEDQDEGGILIAGVGKTGYNIAHKSEAWRRGYYEVLLGAARAAEHLDGWVRDRTRRIAFPMNVVIGPSNPNPRPVPPGAVSAPKEEDCEPAYDPPETFYLRALTTQGFTQRQKLDAALGFAAWLDYKGTPEAAEDMYKWALDIAATSSSNPEAVFDNTGSISHQAWPASSNMLSAATALAIHHARNSNLSLALPIFISVLKARRSLRSNHTGTPPTLEPELNNDQTSFLRKIGTLINSGLPKPYFPPTDAGTSPPEVGARERCEEAAIMAYIGEILYASNKDVTRREEGVAWTRDAVDRAEEELRGNNITKDAKIACTQCLETGIGNWAKMVTWLAQQEKVRKDSPPRKASRWWWSSKESAVPAHQEALGRWEAEEYVVQERIRRVGDVLSSPKSPQTGNFLFT